MIALITPTGGRPIQFDICVKLMERQTYRGRVAWVIIDDVDPISTDQVKPDFRKNWDIIKIRPKPLWQLGLNTQGRNIAHGINAVFENYDAKDIEAFFIIEDDDYYKPFYLEKMLKQLNGYILAGEMHSIYYNLRLRRWIEHENEAWSSLFQTAFTIETIPTLTKIYSQKFIDYELFKAVKHGVNLFRDGDYAIGIKGMPGRGGIGAGHGFIKHMKADDNLVKFKELLGDDVKFYMNNDGDLRCL